MKKISALLLLTFFSLTSCTKQNFPAYVSMETEKIDFLTYRIDCSIKESDDADFNLWLIGLLGSNKMDISDATYTLNGEDASIGGPYNVGKEFSITVNFADKDYSKIINDRLEFQVYESDDKFTLSTSDFVFTESEN